MADVMSVTESNFQEEVLEADKPVFVDFWAPWCGYCQRLSPILEEMGGELRDRVKIVKMNVDENRNVAQRYGIMSLPTMLLFKNGEVAEKLMGYMPKANIEAKIMPKL